MSLNQQGANKVFGPVYAWIPRLRGSCLPLPLSDYYHKLGKTPVFPRGDKYGVHLEVVADASNGVVCHFEAYTGAAGNEDNTVVELVQRILTPFQNQNHKVFMDRRYSSPLLFQSLLEKGFYPVGTVVKSRKNLPKAFEKRLKAGETVNRRKEQLLAVKWKDKRDVSILSTVDKEVMIVRARRKRRSSDHQTIISDHIQLW